MKKLLIIVSLVLMTLAACGTDEDSAQDENTITIEHELGEATVVESPENVVVFDLGMLDTLDTLDLPVTGVPKDNLPSYLSHYESDEYEHAGGLKEPDFEAIYGMEPDLIIISGRQADLYEDLEEIAPTVYVETDSEAYMESISRNVGIIGDIFNVQDEVNEAIDEIQAEVDAVQELTSLSDQTGLITLATGGSVSAYGSGSRFGLIHDMLGVTPVDESIEVATHGQNISFEFIVEQDPDYLFVIDRDAVVEGEATAQETIENSLIENTTAYQNNQIFYLNPEYWYIADGGLQSVSEMVYEIKSAVE
ncbi:siderophore ABC transporter substrate-binding protein [Alkalibacillus haloalkaliphilus]|uniref:siderophore ABC transporter substrate-binding protein n=1 Tax=Alkalibacillus haloalkaliphilus TaxID=94136 RepID=UPI0029363C1F|nr:siderophore ABC transporter substrate-binding protein [Alkalibacillus haloalkaliphilus]MDV2582989.1 siderophore ABC transporter substrate-binding protein [Alkalibacillus haloalkaliphilus]